MLSLSPLLGIPPRIASLEHFGIGEFTPKEVERKCAEIQSVMSQRAVPREQPTFSVVVPAHKETKCLLATLKSLALQSYPDAEFLIVSNGEPRDNPTMRMAKDCGFTVIHEQKGGVGRARQTGLHAARGLIVASTDADTLHNRDWLRAAAIEFSGDADLVAGFGWVNALSSSSLQQACMQIHSAWRSLQGSRLFFSASEANSFFIRKAALAVGGYEAEDTYYEGTRLFKKLAEHGEIRGINDARAAVYTSDRRLLSERVQAVLQYLTSLDARTVKYEVVR